MGRIQHRVLKKGSKGRRKGKKKGKWGIVSGEDHEFLCRDITVMIICFFQTVRRLYFSVPLTLSFVL